MRIVVDEIPNNTYECMFLNCNDCKTCKLTEKECDCIHYDRGNEYRSAPSLECDRLVWIEDIN